MTLEESLKQTAIEIIRGVGVDPEQHGGIHIAHVQRILAKVFERGQKEGK